MLPTIHRIILLIKIYLTSIRSKLRKKGNLRSNWLISVSKDIFSPLLLFLVKLGSCVYRENRSDSWDILWFTTRKRCINVTDVCVLFVFYSYVSVCNIVLHPGGVGDLHMKGTGLVVRKFELKMFPVRTAQSQNPNVCKHYKRLTRWNTNRCYSLRTTYLIFETFQILFPTASLIFTAVKLFHEVIWERTKY